MNTQRITSYVADNFIRAGCELSSDQRSILAGSLAVWLTRPRMSKDEFKALVKCVNIAQKEVPFIRAAVCTFMNDEAKRHGFKNWADAYQRIGE